MMLMMLAHDSGILEKPHIQSQCSSVSSAKAAGAVPAMMRAQVAGQKPFSKPKKFWPSWLLLPASRFRGVPATNGSNDAEHAGPSWSATAAPSGDIVILAPTHIALFCGFACTNGPNDAHDAGPSFQVARQKPSSNP